jgi:molybdopterin-guanine dinucleotide biosynthesis protein
MILEFNDNVFDDVEEIHFNEELITYFTGVVAIFAPPKTGKTTLALWQMRSAIKLGLIKSFVYIDLDSKNKAQQKQLNLASKKEGWVYVSKNMIKNTFKNNYEFFIHIAKYYNEKGYTNFIIDTWQKLTAHIPENDATAIKPITEALTELSTDGIHIRLIAHTGKDLTKQIRGSSDIRGVLTQSIRITKEEGEKESLVTIIDDSLGDNGGRNFKMLLKGQSNDIIISEVKEKKKVLSNFELKELKIQQQKTLLTAYIASVLVEKGEDIPTTELKNFILRNVNNLPNGKKKNQVHEEYIPTSLIKKTYANLLETTFNTYKETKEGSKKPLTMVKTVDKEKFLDSQENINELPEVYKMRGK